MVNPERSHQQQRKEQQKPPEYRKDSPELIAQEWESLKLEEVRDILIKEQLDWAFKWAEEKLKKDPNYSSLSEEEKKKRKEEKIKELVRELQSISDKNTLIQKLEELGLDTKEIINLFGLVYIPKNYTVIAVTDIHGDIYALEEAIKEFETIKGQGKNVAFVCMGDFVDRGEYNFEVLKRLFELKRKYQDEVIILKGDHEDDVFEPRKIQIEGKDEEVVLEPHIRPAEFALQILGVPREFIEYKLENREYDIFSSWIEHKYGELSISAISQHLEYLRRARELYIDTFSKLPHAVIYRDVLITHAGLPVDVKIEGGQINFEKGGTLGRLIAPSKEDLRQIYWSDIDLSIDVNRGRIGESIDLSPTKYSEIVRDLGFQYFIRGHQYSYRGTSLFGNSSLAYRLFEESIITFHSNQSYYVNKRAYTEGCYLVLNPDGSIVAKGVEGEQEIPIIQPKEEISAQETSQKKAPQAALSPEKTMGEETPSLKEGALKPQEAENQGGVEEQELSSSERRELKFESLDDRIQVFIGEVMRDYEKFIKLVIQNPDDFRRELLEIIEENIKEILERKIDEEEATLPPDIKDENVRKLLALNSAFIKEEENLKTMVRRYIGLMLLSDENLLKNENTKNEVKEFLEKWCSLDDLIYFVNVMEPKEAEVLGIPVKICGETKEIHFKARTFKINEAWKGILLIKLAEKLKTKEELEKYLKTILNLIKKYRNLLIENYARKYEQEGFNPQEARKKAEEFVDEFIRNLERNLPQIINLSQEELEQVLNGLKGLAEQVEKAEKEGKKEIDWGPILDNIKLVGGLLASGFLLWIAFLGFFAPLWLIEKVKKDVKI
jgi:hypothetical protein